jgi:hypothetical protein
MEIISTSGQQSWSPVDIVLFEEIFQLQCTSRLNSLYYSDRLRSLQRVSLFMEFSIAATASGSGLGSLLSKSSNIPHGDYLWGSLLLIAAIVSIVRPIYAPGRKIELMTRQQHGYTANFFALKKLAHNIRQAGRITDEMRREFDSIFDRHVQLSADDEAAPSGRKLEKARCQTESELPRSRFWWPFSDWMPESPDKSSQPEQMRGRSKNWRRLLKRAG